MNDYPKNYLTKSETYKMTTTPSNKISKQNKFLSIACYSLFWLLILGLALFIKKSPLFSTASLLPKTPTYSEHSLEYLIGPDATSYPTSLLELASKKPETIDFVKNYSHYLEGLETMESISLVADYTPGEIPLLIQWDTRWGYEYYGDEFIAVNGCGPTSLSMVAVGLTGNTHLNPKVIADFSYEQGYFVKGRGSSWDLMTKGAHSLGLTSKELPLNDTSILKELSSGHPIIASMKPGDFTTSGHFIVLVGLAPNGEIIVNDPDSIVRSHQTWDLKTLTKQIKNLWAFSL